MDNIFLRVRRGWNTNMSWLHHQAMVIISALASICLYDAESSPPKVPTPAIVVRTSAGGLSFWSSLWLAVAATPLQLFAWYARPRNKAGLCQPADQLQERTLVLDWAVEVDGLSAASRDRIHQHESATCDDIDPWRELYCINCQVYCSALCVVNCRYVTIK